MVSSLDKREVVVMMRERISEGRCVRVVGLWVADCRSEGFERVGACSEVMVVVSLVMDEVCGRVSVWRKRWNEQMQRQFEWVI